MKQDVILVDDPAMAVPAEVLEQADAAGNAGPAGPATAVDPALLPAEPARLAAGSLLLDIGESDQRAIAVGERGHILVSESRHDWRQVKDVPTRATLTGVSAVGSKVWAVGHAQVILHSADGGLSWQRQHAQPYDPAHFEDIANGAPLLDVLFLDELRGIAIGGYGLLLSTADGGASWRRGSVSGAAAIADGASAEVVHGEQQDEDSWTFSDEDLALEELADPHLNAIAQTGSGGLLIVAERGSAFRSRDGGTTWERLTIPYDGSMFGVIGYDDERVLAFGLRGNVFESTDLGSTWKAIDSGTEQTLQGGAPLEGGGAVLVGSNGVVLVRSDAAAPFTSHVFEEGGVLAEVLPVAGAAQLVVIGEHGIGRYSPD